MANETQISVSFSIPKLPEERLLWGDKIVIIYRSEKGLLETIRGKQNLEKFFYQWTGISFNDALPFFNQRVLEKLQEAARENLNKRNVVLQAIDDQSRICIDIFNQQVTLHLAFQEVSSTLSLTNTTNSQQTLTINARFSLKSNEGKISGELTVQEDEHPINSTPFSESSDIPAFSINENKPVIILTALPKDFEWYEGFTSLCSKEFDYSAEITQLRTEKGKDALREHMRPDTPCTPINRELMGLSSTDFPNTHITSEAIRSQLIQKQIQETQIQDEFLLCLRSPAILQGLLYLQQLYPDQRAKVLYEKKTLNLNEKTVTLEVFFQLFRLANSSNPILDEPRAGKFIIIYNISEKTATVEIFENKPLNYLDSFCRKYKLNQTIAETINITQDISTQLQDKNTRTLVRKNIRLGFWNRLTILIAGLLNLNNFIIRKLSQAINSIKTDITNYKSIKKYSEEHYAYTSQGRLADAKKALDQLNALLDSLSLPKASPSGPPNLD